MRLPRDVSGQRLANALRVLGYAPTRQDGDHLRLTTQQNGEHHLTIPLHKSLRVGTLANILSDVQAHFGLTRDELLERLTL
ncbi:MAG TPA: type II toxin-antitoxin system HicA family toxin [Chthonomonadaceae bacterium]|nr:type II toxin-antitoxin system HicA family toxin [Chthonomonadaceae bacterium]